MTHAECAKSRLPGKLRKRWKLFMHPSRGVCLHSAQHIGDSQLRRKRSQDVDMIGRAINEKWLAVQFANDASHVREKSSPQIGAHEGKPLLGAEYDMCI